MTGYNNNNDNTYNTYNIYTILWDTQVHTDREIKANRPDIIIKDKVHQECTLIDMAIPADRNIAAKKVEKLSKYKDLELEITRMWGMKCTTIPVIIGALGTIQKGTEALVATIPAPDIHLQEIQKIALKSAINQQCIDGQVTADGLPFLGLWNKPE